MSANEDTGTPDVGLQMHWRRDDCPMTLRFQTNEDGTWIERAWGDLDNTFATLQAIVDHQLSFMREKHLVRFTFEIEVLH